MWPPPFLYPPSAFVAAASLVAVFSLASLGLSELRGEHVAYSKFSHAGGGGQQRGGGGGGGALLPGRAGMIVSYVPALVAVLAAFAVPGAVDGARAQVLCAALAAHFLKRVLEVLFVHRYSGSMPLGTVVQISTCYLLYVIMHAGQHAAPQPRPPGPRRRHALPRRARLRRRHRRQLLPPPPPLEAASGGKGYKIPRGGMFELVACPHYLFEIVAFFGLAMIGQTAFALALAVGTAAFLACRSWETRKWYAAKFEEFPERIRALVPYVL
ncbi:unnamed protein product [Urochloa decumbens]|uniref:3-oxo-5-alpha-steroid 4-dehydrogenase C-terminal domain-containing protein n=1 Tax=Urochloa decumbens TaxID=240449 RepID=A0ABC9EZG1_9POAL